MEKLFDRLAGICKKIVYIALAALLLMVLADRVKADDSETTGMAPAIVTVETETDAESGFTSVTVYIRTFIKDVQDKYRELVDTKEVSDETEAPKPS